MDIGKRMREIRQSSGLKIKELADLMDMSQSYLNQIELGDRKCPPWVLNKFLEVMGITAAEFFMESIPVNPVPAHEKRFYDLAKKLSSKEKEVIGNLMELLVEKGEKKGKTKVFEGKETGHPYVGQKFPIGDLEVAESHAGPYGADDEPIDLRSTPMAAHIEGAESVPLTPELEKTIKDGIREARRRRRDREEKEHLGQEKKNREENGATTGDE